MYMLKKNWSYSLNKNMLVHISQLTVNHNARVKYNNSY